MRKDRVSPVLAAGPCRSFQGNAATGGGSFGSSFRVYQARFGYVTDSEIASCHGERNRFLPLQVQLDFPFQTEPDCVIPSAAAFCHREGGRVRSGRTRPYSVIADEVTSCHSEPIRLRSEPALSDSRMGQAARSNLTPVGLRLLRRYAPRNDIHRFEIVSNMTARLIALDNLQSTIFGQERGIVAANQVMSRCRAK